MKTVPILVLAPDALQRLPLWPYANPGGTRRHSWGVGAPCWLALTIRWGRPTLSPTHGKPREGRSGACGVWEPRHVLPPIESDQLCGRRGPARPERPRAPRAICPTRSRLITANEECSASGPKGD